MLKFLGTPLLILLLATPAVATQPSYCLSQVSSPKPKPEVPPPSRPKLLPEFEVRLRNVPYQIVAVDDWLQFYRSNYMIGQIQAPQFVSRDDYSREHGLFQDIKLDRYGWFWIDGAVLDYVFPLKFNGDSLSLSKPVIASELKARPCSMLQKIFSCPRASGSYSNVLKQIFYTGYEVSFFGTSSPLTYTIVEGKLTPLPKVLQGARFERDVPSVNGVLFRGQNHEAIFYDGKTATLLLPGSPRGAEIYRAHWIAVDTLDQKRTFLTNIRTSVRAKPLFLQELTSEPKLIPLTGVNVLEKFLELFSLRGDARVWVVSKNALFAEVNGHFKRVFSFPQPIYSQIWQTADGAIGFNLKDPKNMGSGSPGGRNYFLRPASPTATCPIPINLGSK